MKVTTKSGYELELQAVNRIALQDLLYRLGFQGASDVREKFNTLDADKQQALNKNILQTFNYCFVFGVVTEPEQDDLGLLGAMGFEVKPAKLAKLNWLRYLVLADEAEAGKVWSEILRLTFAAQSEEESTDDED